MPVNELNINLLMEQVKLYILSCFCHMPFQMTISAEHTPLERKVEIMYVTLSVLCRECPQWTLCAPYWQSLNAKYIGLMCGCVYD